MFNRIKNLIGNLIGDKKVKVEEGFVARIRKFWSNILHKEEEKENKVLEALKKIGAKLSVAPEEVDAEYEPLEEDVVYAESYTIEELFEKLKELNPDKEIELLGEGYKKISYDGEPTDLVLPEGWYYNDKNGFTNKHHTIDGAYNTYDVTTKKIEKPEEPEMTKVEPEEYNGDIVSDILTYSRTSNIFEIERLFDLYGADKIWEEFEKKIENGDLDKENLKSLVSFIKDNQEKFKAGKNQIAMRASIFENETFKKLEEKYLTEEDTKEEVEEEPEIEQQQEEPEVKEEPKEETPEEEVEMEEKPVESEGKDVTSEINGSAKLDLVQFATYDDYLRYFFETRIDSKEDMISFFLDHKKGNYPVDFIDEKTFIKEKKSQEDEIEHNKLEAEKASLEKALEELKEEYSVLTDQNAELETRFKDRDSKLSTQRKTNVTLKQEIKDLKAEIKQVSAQATSLKAQLTTAQSAAKDAQAASYKDRRTIAEIEEQLKAERKNVSDLTSKLSRTKEELIDAKEELKKATERVKKMTSDAIARIRSISADDDLEQTALNWAEKNIKEDEEATLEEVNKIEEIKKEREEALDKATEERAKKIEEGIYKTSEEKVEEATDEIMDRIHKNVNGEEKEEKVPDIFDTPIIEPKHFSSKKETVEETTEPVKEEPEIKKGEVITIQPMMVLPPTAPVVDKEPEEEITELQKTGTDDFIDPYYAVEIPSEPEKKGRGRRR